MLSEGPQGHCVQAGKTTYTNAWRHERRGCLLEAHLLQNTAGLGGVKAPGREKSGKRSRVLILKCFVGHTEEFRFYLKAKGSHCRILSRTDTARSLTVSSATPGHHHHHSDCSVWKSEQVTHCLKPCSGSTCYKAHVTNLPQLSAPLPFSPCICSAPATWPLLLVQGPSRYIPP